ncbi:MAG: DHHA1 domain-containing protein, partial [Ktedonobacterales bacterium]
GAGAGARPPRGARDDTARFAVAVGDGWALGVLGLVAGRLAEDLGKPAVVISRTGDECRGSARGAAGVNLGALLAGRADLFTRFGGHAQAAGFTLASANLPQLLAYLDERFAAAAGAGAQASPAPNAGASDLDASPTPNADPHADAELMVDCELSFHRATELYDEIVWLAPYGPGFAEPVFVARGLRLVGCRPTGSGQHLRLTLREGRSTTSAMLPRQGQRAAAIQAALATLPPLDVAYTLSAYRRADSGARVVMPRVVSLALSRP